MHVLLAGCPTPEPWLAYGMKTIGVGSDSGCAMFYSVEYLQQRRLVLDRWDASGRKGVGKEESIGVFNA